jgi:signal transduction histidine kinase
VSPGAARLLARGLWVFGLGSAVIVSVLTALNRPTVETGDWVINFLLPAIGLAYVTVGAVVAARQATVLGWMLCTLGIGVMLAGFSQEYTLYATVTNPGSLPAPAAAATLESAFGVGASMVGPIFLLFPNGRVPGPRWRWLLWTAPGAGIAATALFVVRPGPLNGAFNDYGVTLINPIGVTGARTVVDVLVRPFIVVAVVSAIACAISIVVRFRRSSGDERQQIRWLAYVGTAAMFFIVSMIATGLVFGEGPANDLAWLGFFLTISFGIPAACGIAILRYRLYELDVVVKKTVVFAVVVAIVTGLYLMVAVAIPALVLGGDASVDRVPVLLGILIGLLVIPVRNRARHLADRVVYGRRASPYEVLSEFSDRLAETYSTSDVLPRMVQLLGASTGAREVRVWLRVGDELSPVEAWPPEAGIEVPRRMRDEELPGFEGVDAFPVRHQGEVLGAFTLSMPANDPMDLAKEKLVRDLAGQAGLVLRNARLIEELRASRRRIVAAQDERAKALERNIHDGAQQQLVALAIKLRLAQQLVARDPGKAETMLSDLQGEANDTLENVRDLARGIYPPLLADRGLPAALEAQARKAPVPISVQSVRVERYGLEVESAVYFCALEALANVAKYAHASRATIRLSQSDGHLTFEVDDDGEGFDPERARGGTGLQGMADRLEAVGGTLEVRSVPGRGTRIRGVVPVAPVSPS